ncbi:hypothetical protein DKY63_10435 [Pseudomonas putida]|uniref:Uncharacterized protein n=1 Tax=Pseudomonas putida TaxID=303 RepID=A0A2Z4RH70_PSEPU|nr:hypothetical protein DKY63_10435 [Pseudomonas putida]
MSSDPPPSRAGSLPQFFCTTSYPVGAKLARDGGVSVTIFVDWTVAIASKLCSYRFSVISGR